jgi:hypothetical protein
MRDCHYRTACGSLLWQRIATALAIVTGLLVAVGSQCAVADDTLATLIKEAREGFQPVTDEQLASARADLVRQADALQRFLVPGSTNGQNWNRYLMWDALQQQLASDQPTDYAPFEATYFQLEADHNGLELAPFRRLSNALRRHIDLAMAARSTNAQQVYQRQLDMLSSELDQYAQAPTPWLAFSIGQRLDFIAELGQAPELIAAVRQQYAQPNAFVTVSATLLNETAGAEPIDRSDPVTDCILGASIRGTSHTCGTVSVRTVPNEDRAILELMSVGDSESINRGYKGPAVIRSTAHTGFTATTLVELSDQEFRAHTVHADARTRSNIHSVSKQGGGFGSLFVSRIGWSKAQESHARADSIASAHAENRIRRRITDDVSDKLQDARDRYEENYRDPLASRGKLPEQIKFYTTEDSMDVKVTQANDWQLAASGGPPALPGGQDLVVRVHQSALNNYAAAVLSGATARETEPGEETQFNVALPDWLKNALVSRNDTSEIESDGQEPFKPWSLTFHRGQAISVAFGNGQVELTIHMARLTSGDDEFTDWDVTGTFTPEMKDGGIVLHRQGDLVVLPTGFDRARGQLSSRQVAIRSNLTKVLNERAAEGRGFPQTITIDALDLSDQLDNVGPLWADEFMPEDGWVTMAWNRQ